jgi:hypothetical protein
MSMPRDAYSGKTGQRSGACGATATKLECGGASAARLGPNATAAAESRGCSAGGEASAGLERR